MHLGIFSSNLPKFKSNKRMQSWVYLSMQWRIDWDIEYWTWDVQNLRTIVDFLVAKHVCACWKHDFGRKNNYKSSRVWLRENRRYFVSFVHSAPSGLWLQKGLKKLINFNAWIFIHTLCIVFYRSIKYGYSFMIHKGVCRST